MSKTVIQEKFEVDPAIIGDLIYSQNGTVATAIRELVMNSIDAGSQSVKIRISNSKFEVIDEGRGFPSEEYIKSFFKKFGTPHEDGDATYGRFRIGRGQIMALGQVSWHSNQFRMTTDIKNKGYGYELEESSEDRVSGCTVSGEFYESLDAYKISRVREELEKLLRYAPQKIMFNGSTISVGADVDWHYEDDQVKVLWEPSKRIGINLYSQGIFVKKIDAKSFGLNADIVTNDALVLNMARNEVNEQDPLWQKIFRLLTDKSIEVNSAMAKNARLTEEARISLIRNFIDGHMDLMQVRDLPLFKDCRNRKAKFSWVFGSLPITLAPSDRSRLAEKVASSNIARVLHYDELRYWGVDSVPQLLNTYYERVMDYLNANKGENSHVNRWARDMAHDLLDAKVVNFDRVSVGISEDMEVIKASELKPRERAAKNALKYANRILIGRINKIKQADHRQVEVGASAVADGWTDGANYIVVERRMLALLDTGIPGALQIVNLLVHEYCHDTSDIGSHSHDFEFYELYHDLTSMHSGKEVVGHAARSLLDRYHHDLIKNNEPLPKSAKAPFEYPVLNEQYAVTGTLTSGLSQLSRMLLTSLDYTARKSKFSLTVNYEDAYKQAEKARSTIILQMESDGVLVHSLESVLISHSSRESGVRDYNKQLLSAVKQWAKSHGHDIAVVRKLFTPQHMGTSFSQILGMVCLDENSGLQNAVYDQLTTVRRVIAEKVNLRDDLSRYLRKNRHYKAHLSKLGGVDRSSAARFNYVLSKVRESVAILECEKEREEFYEQYFTEELKALK